MRFSCFFVPYPYIYIGRNTFSHLSRSQENGEAIVGHVRHHLFLIRVEGERDQTVVQTHGHHIRLDKVERIKHTTDELLLLKNVQGQSDPSLLQLLVSVVKKCIIFEHSCKPYLYGVQCDSFPPHTVGIPEGGFVIIIRLS